MGDSEQHRVGLAFHRNLKGAIQAVPRVEAPSYLAEGKNPERGQCNGPWRRQDSRLPKGSIGFYRGDDEWP